MEKLISLGSLELLPPGEGRTFDVRGHRVAVFHTRTGQVYATQADCPHKQGPLADGMLGGTTLVCPLHEWKFDLTTGRSNQGECQLKVYPVQQTSDGQLLLEWRDD